MQHSRPLSPMIRMIALWATFFCFLSCISSPETPTEQDLEASDPHLTHRVVSLSPALTEIVFALGGGDQLVGVTEFCDFPEQAQTLPKMGGYSNPSVEIILEAKPDLVLISKNTGNQHSGLTLIEAGLNVKVIPAESLSDSTLAIRAVAEALKIEVEGEALANKLESALAELAQLEPLRSTGVLLLSLEPLMVAGSDTLPGEALSLAGIQHALPLSGYPAIGIESLIEANPDYILFASMNPSDANEPERIAAFFEPWTALPTLESGGLQVFDASRILRPGPRIAEGIRDLRSRVESFSSE